MGDDARVAVTVAEDEQDEQNGGPATEEERQQQQAMRAEMDELDFVRRSGPDHEPNAIDEMLAADAAEAEAGPAAKAELPAEQEKTTVNEQGAGGAVTEPAKTEATAAAGAEPADTPKVPTIEDLIKRLDAVESESAKLRKENARLNTKLVEAHERMKQAPPASGEQHTNQDDSEIDPDVDSTLNKWEQKKRVNAYHESEADLLEDLAEDGIDRSDYDDAVSRFFVPAIEADPRLKRRWNRATDPARFAYEEGRKIRDRVSAPKEDVVPKADVEKRLAELEAKVEAAREEGRQEALKGILSTAKRADLPPSLSQAGRTPTPAASQSNLRKELDEL